MMTLARSTARFVLTVETAPGQAGIHALRAALKVLGRSYGVRVVEAFEERPDAALDLEKDDFS
jgi:hypothetical protein